MEALTILLIEDEEAQAKLIKLMLSDEIRPSNSGDGGRYELICTRRLSGGLERLVTGGIDLVLCDLELPESSGLDTFAAVHDHSPDIPIVVLTSCADETIAIKAMQRGAQDYLQKGNVDGDMLRRSIRYAVERNKLQMELRALTLNDELTNLYNRRGFLTLTSQQVKIAKRAGRNLYIVYMDLDYMKWINDNMGHREGDCALVEFSSILKETFRESDIIGRLGGDEFAVMVVDSAGEGVEGFISRLKENVEKKNAEGVLRCRLSISTGVVPYDSWEPCPIEELINKADEAMYQEKKRKQDYLAREGRPGMDNGRKKDGGGDGR